MEPSYLFDSLSNKKLKSVSISIEDEKSKGRYRKTKDLEKISKAINLILDGDEDIFDLPKEKQKILQQNLRKIDKKIEKRNNTVNRVKNFDFLFFGKLIRFFYHKEIVERLHLLQVAQGKDELPPVHKEKPKIPLIIVEDMSKEPEKEIKKSGRLSKQEDSKEPEIKKSGRLTKSEMRKNEQLKEIYQADPRIQIITEKVGKISDFIQLEKERLKKGEAKIFLYLRETSFKNFSDGFPNCLLILRKDDEGEFIHYIVTFNDDQLYIAQFLQNYQNLEELIQKENLTQFVFWSREEEVIDFPNSIINSNCFKGAYTSCGNFIDEINPQKENVYIFYSKWGDDRCYFCHYNGDFFPFEITKEGFVLERKMTFETLEDLIDHIKSIF